MQLVFVTIFAAIERKYFGEEVFERKAELKRHGVVAAAMTASRGLTNMSLQYLNYPTQVVFKSLKLLTVMIGSALFVGRTYKGSEYLATAFTVASAMLFGFADQIAKGKGDGPQSSALGFLIVSLSLVADSMHSNTQETLLQDYKATIRETMFYTNMFAAFFTFGVTAVTGELSRALAFCAQYPNTWWLLAIQSLVTYLGVLCFVGSIKKFGVVLATTVTTVRKILTVMLSFIFFAKPFNSIYAYGILMFVASFVIGFYVQYQQIQAGLGLGKNVESKNDTSSTSNTNSSGSQPAGNASARPNVGEYQQLQNNQDTTDTDIDISLNLGDAIDDDLDGLQPHSSYNKMNKQLVR